MDFSFLAISSTDTHVLINSQFQLRESVGISLEYFNSAIPARLDKLDR